MRITMQRVWAHTIIRYQCRVCRKKYATEDVARQCEARGVERQAFILGQVARTVERQECCKRHKFFAKGVVKGISGPMSLDEGHENRLLEGGSQKSGPHIYVYTFKYFSPHCKKAKKIIAFAHELKPG